MSTIYAGLPIRQQAFTTSISIMKLNKKCGTEQCNQDRKRRFAFLMVLIICVDCHIIPSLFCDGQFHWGKNLETEMREWRRMMAIVNAHRQQLQQQQRGPRTDGNTGEEQQQPQESQEPDGSEPTEPPEQLQQQQQEQLAEGNKPTQEEQQPQVTCRYNSFINIMFD